MVFSGIDEKDKRQQKELAIFFQEES